jgi:hypothetical protein
MKNISGMIINGNAAANIPDNTHVKRPFKIGAALGILGGFLAVIGTSFPWFENLSSGRELISGIFIPEGGLTFIFGLTGFILCAFRKRIIYLGVALMGWLVLIFSGLVLRIIFADGYVEYGVYVSFTGGLLLVAGGFIGFVHAPK